MTAAVLHANSGVFATDDVLFDWEPIDIPKGTSRLKGITAVLRMKNGTVTNEFPFEVIFARSINGVEPPSIGTGNATVGGTGFYNHVIGSQPVLAADFMADSFDNGICMAAANCTTRALLLEGEPNQQFPNVDPVQCAMGYDRIYVAAIAGGAFDFSTAVEISQTVDVSGLSACSLVNADLEGTDPRLAFVPGDRIVAQDGVLLGEIKSMPDANTINFKCNNENSENQGTTRSIKFATAGRVGNYGVPKTLASWIALSADLADGDLLYNTTPIKLILHLEK